MSARKAAARVPENVTGVDAYAPAQIAERIQQAGVVKANMALDKLLKRGVRPARVAELQERLSAWRRGVAAVMPTVNPEPVDPYGPQGLPRKP